MLKTMKAEEIYYLEENFSISLPNSLSLSLKYLEKVIYHQVKCLKHDLLGPLIFILRVGFCEVQ